MKVYKCDACGTIMDDPYKVDMTRFHIVTAIDECGVFPENSKMKVKVDLCDKCYKALSTIAERKIKNNKNA